MQAESACGSIITGEWSPESRRGGMFRSYLLFVIPHRTMPDHAGPTDLAFGSFGCFGCRLEFAHLRLAPEAEFTAELAGYAEILAEDDISCRISHSDLY
jgi:hypothetical protein